MYAGKTKLGVDLKSTVNLKKVPKTTTWYLVADAARACLYEKAKDRGDINLKQQWKNLDARKKSLELVSDKPGRSFDSHTQSTHGQTGAPRHSLSQRLTPTEEATLRFAQKMANNLSRERKNGRFEKLVLVAEPKLLGSLKTNLDKETLKLLKATYQKDYSWISESDVLEHLKELDRKE
jgi:protein required for attachment to host cells